MYENQTETNSQNTQFLTLDYRYPCEHLEFTESSNVGVNTREMDHRGKYNQNAIEELQTVLLAFELQMSFLQQRVTILEGMLEEPTHDIDE